MLSAGIIPAQSTAAKIAKMAGCKQSDASEQTTCNTAVDHLVEELPKKYKLKEPAR